MQTVKVVSDLICPWCYVGKKRLEAALAKLRGVPHASVSWHPFQLNPDMPAEGMDRREYCIRKFGSWNHCEEMFAQISVVGKTVGLDFRFDRQPVIPNTFDAHRVIWLAGRKSLQDEVVEALFRAYFCDGVDLSHRSELTDVAVEAGLERERVQQLLDSDEGAREVRMEEQDVKSLGISSVPLFIIDEQVAVSGAQPPEVLLDAFQQAQKLRKRRPARRAVASQPGA